MGRGYGSFRRCLTSVTTACCTTMVSLSARGATGWLCAPLRIKIYLLYRMGTLYARYNAMCGGRLSVQCSDRHAVRYPRARNALCCRPGAPGLAETVLGCNFVVDGLRRGVDAGRPSTLQIMLSGIGQASTERAVGVLQPAHCSGVRLQAAWTECARGGFGGRALQVVERTAGWRARAGRRRLWLQRRGTANASWSVPGRHASNAELGCPAARPPPMRMRSLDVTRPTNANWSRQPHQSLEMEQGPTQPPCVQPVVQL